MIKNNSLYFILPYLGLNSSTLMTQDTLQFFMGASYLDKDWGEYSILQIPNDPIILNELQLNPYYHSFNVIDATKIHVIFTIPEDIKAGLVTPFLKGEYSKISRNLVDKFFPPNTSNRAIIDKSPQYLDYWKQKIEPDISWSKHNTSYENWLKVNWPTDCEVWPKPEKEKEIYGFLEHTVRVPV